MFPPCDYRGSAGTTRCWCRHPQRTIDRPTLAECQACPLVQPQLPRRSFLLDDVDIVTTSFNFAAFESIERNLQTWVESLGPLRSQLTIMSARMAFQEPLPYPEAVHFPATREHWLWQKEPLLNYAVQHVLQRPYVAWIDADLLGDWEQLLGWGRTLLESGARMVQLFSRIDYLDQSGKFEESRRCAMSGSARAPGGAWMARRDDLMAMQFVELSTVGGNDQFQFDALTRGPNRGNPGAAWMARRDDLIQMTFPEMFIGGGDRVVWDGLTFDEMKYLQFVHPEIREFILHWGAQAREVIGPHLAYVPGTLRHLWHGSGENRQYWERWKLHQQVTPQMLTHDGPLLRWTDAAPPALQESIRAYFADRREDGHLPPCQHRGQIVERIQSGCSRCEARPIYACGVHGLCVETAVIKEETRGTTACDTCPDFQQAD